MPGRKWTGGDRYRFGFNGKENDKEVSEGFQNYGYRVNDTRIGRFFSVDPLRHSFPWYSPYQFAGNSPIVNIDLDGLEDISIHKIPGKSISMQVVYTREDVKQVLDGKTPEKRITYTKDGSTEIKRTSQFEGPAKGSEQKLFNKLSGTAEGNIRNKDLLGEDVIGTKNEETIADPGSETPAAKQNNQQNNNNNNAPSTKTIKYATFDIQVERNFIQDFSKLGDDYIKKYISDMKELYKKQLGVPVVNFGKINLVDKINIPTGGVYGGGSTTDPKVVPVIVDQGTIPVPNNTPTNNTPTNNPPTENLP